MTDKTTPAPELHNSEQDDSMSQAHNVAKQARDHASHVAGATESTKSDNDVPMGASPQDTIDHMRDMESSGRIDMDAYAGEPNHDDNVDKYGKDNRPGDLPKGVS
uniref:hypothetical protein n=1 Tax=Parerythrobacter lutipelagi TaxID=1964208 RepID=UPI001F01A7BB|nr:hypothetical protein [Parerythrobacter lutipelagi]